MKMVKALVIGLLLCMGNMPAKPKATESVREITVKVNGMVCPICSQGVKLALKKLPATEKVHKIDIKTGQVIIKLKKNHGMSREALVAELQKRIANAGYTFGGIQSEK